jgi:hypothetical protein
MENFSYKKSPKGGDMEEEKNVENPEKDNITMKELLKPLEEIDEE